VAAEPAATHREAVERWVALFNEDREAWHAALPPGIVLQAGELGEVRVFFDAAEAREFARSADRD
jgi:hypothetical protein